MTERQQRFREALETHWGIVAKVARTYCWHADDREELVQEICTQLWLAFPRYDESRVFSSWMYRIALNVAISWVRQHSARRRRLVAFDEAVHEPSVQLTAPDEDGRLAFLQRFIATLDPLHRGLVLLYLDEKTHAEIADILGISVSNVGTKIGRIKKRLRDASVAEKQRGRPWNSMT